MRPNTVQMAQAWLDQFLDMSPEEIAATLEEAGLQGEVQNDYACPLALGLKAVTGNHDCGVDCEKAWVGSRGMPLSSPLQNFIWKFDNGEFPSLWKP